MDSEKKLTEAMHEIQREYAREWRRKNPEKVRAMNRRYWERKARERLENRKGDTDAEEV